MRKTPRRFRQTDSCYCRIGHRASSKARWQVPVGWFQHPAGALTMLPFPRNVKDARSSRLVDFLAGEAHLSRSCRTNIVTIWNDVGVATSL